MPKKKIAIHHDEICDQMKVGGIIFTCNLSSGVLNLFCGTFLFRVKKKSHKYNVVSSFSLDKKLVVHYWIFTRNDWF